MSSSQEPLTNWEMSLFVTIAAEVAHNETVFLSISDY